MTRGFVSSHPVRDRRTEALLLELSTTDDPASRSELEATIIAENLPLCETLARRFSGPDGCAEDLIQVARVGLVVAVRRYRPSERGSFIGFAVPTITGELKRHLRDHGWMVRLPRGLQELRPRVLTAETTLGQELGRPPTARELSLRVDAPTRDVRACLGAATALRARSLDAPAHRDSTVSIGAGLPQPVDPFGALAERIDVRRAVGGLPSRERAVVAWRFVEELTQTQIAERLGVSQMQVSRLLRRALDRLRRALGPESPSAAPSG